MVKHLLVADLSKRYGNLKRGVDDIKNHRWFSGLDWTKLVTKSYEAPWKPTIKSSADTSNFSEYPDSDTQSQAIHPSDDPFTDWWFSTFIFLILNSYLIYQLNK